MIDNPIMSDAVPLHCGCSAAHAYFKLDRPRARSQLWLTRRKKPHPIFLCDNRYRTPSLLSFYGRFDFSTVARVHPVTTGKGTDNEIMQVLYYSRVDHATPIDDSLFTFLARTVDKSPGQTE